MPNNAARRRAPCDKTAFLLRTLPIYRARLWRLSCARRSVASGHRAGYPGGRVRLFPSLATLPSSTETWSIFPFFCDTQLHVVPGPVPAEGGQQVPGVRGLLGAHSRHHAAGIKAGCPPRGVCRRASRGGGLKHGGAAKRDPHKATNEAKARRSTVAAWYGRAREWLNARQRPYRVFSLE